MRLRRWVSTMLVAAALATAAPANAKQYDIDIYTHHDHDAARNAAIGLGITTGVVALVGGAIWYYFHHKHAVAAAAPADAPADNAPTEN